MPFGFGKRDKNKVHKTTDDKTKEKKITSSTHSYQPPKEKGQSDTPPSSSTTELPTTRRTRRQESGTLVQQHKEYYLTLTSKSKYPGSGPRPGSGSGQYSEKTSLEKKPAGSVSSNTSTPSHETSRINVQVSVTSPTSPTTHSDMNLKRTTSEQSSGHSSMSPTPSQENYTPTNKRSSFLESLTDLTSDHGREKNFDGLNLPLPPLQMTNMCLRDVEATKSSPGGAFGFILRKSFLPVPEDPDKMRLIHLVEPHTDYDGPLMTGDRIIEVNGVNVEDEAHEAVVEMIKASEGGVYLRVASTPEMLELNARGALDVTLQRSSALRKSGRGKAKHGTGSLRRQNKLKIKAKTEEEVLSEKERLEQEKVWVVHNRGFSLGTVHHGPSHKSQLPGHYTNMYRLQGRDRLQVKLAHSVEVIDVEKEDIEKANPSSLDKVEDLVDLVHLNESSVLHVLRQRYGSSLVHTFAGNHLIVLNPLKPLSSYVDRVINMFRGCLRADMPPHIFAMGQQAYRAMIATRQDQSLILMGLSGSGKTFNARYLLRYLVTVGQPDQGPVSCARLDAVELLLHSFGSAATFLNPQATQYTCLYTLDFDSSGTVVSASVKTYLLEKFRVAQRPPGEGSFNILHQLIAGADDQLRSELMLDVADEEAEKANLYYEPFDDLQRNESAAFVWDLIQNCLDILDIPEDEAQGLWLLLAAIYHLGFAGVKKGHMKSSDCFQNPVAAQRAALVLGISREALGNYIFSPPKRQAEILSSFFSAESDDMSGTSSLDAFVMGLYDQAVNALVMLINRALQKQTQNATTSQELSRIHVIDMPGFQHRELAGAREGASLDDLFVNYAQERLQMLFYDWMFTPVLDRIQEEINWSFSEVPVSPLPVIDTIDKHVSTQSKRRGASVDLHTNCPGLLRILDEESVFPGANDNSFLDRLQMYHGENSSGGGAPFVKVTKKNQQFCIQHCQRTMSVQYNASGWVKRAKEHPSFRVVVKVLAESKRKCLASIFQTEGVAAMSPGSSSLRDVNVDPSKWEGAFFSSPSARIEKSHICLQAKLQLDHLVGTVRKTHQWFIHCILPQLPEHLPGTLLPEPTGLRKCNDINVPFVRSQVRSAELIKAVRIYKLGLNDERLYKEAIANDISVMLTYVKILALGPGQVGKSTFLYRLMGLMEGNIQTADPETQPQASTGITEQREACIQYTTRTGALTSTNQWKMLDETSELETQVGGLMSLITDQSETGRPLLPKKFSTESSLVLENFSTSKYDNPFSNSEATFSQYIKRQQKLPAKDPHISKSSKASAIEPANDFDHSKNTTENIPETLDDPTSTNNSSFSIFDTPSKSRDKSSTIKKKIVTSQAMINIDSVVTRFEMIKKEARETKSQIQLDILLNIADIGGQPAFLEMLPSLTIGPALYLVFMNLMQGLDTRYPVVFKCKENQKQVVCQNYTYTSEEVIFTALSSIASFGTSDEEVETFVLKENSKQQINSLAVLVGTFADQVSVEKVKILNSKIKQLVQETDFYNKGLLYNTEFMQVNNLSADVNEIEKQRSFIEDLLRNRFRKYQIPARWLMLSICLKLVAKNLNKFELSFTDCVEIGHRFDMTEETVRAALKFLHKYIGLVMYFPNHPILKDIVICDPQIVFSSVSELIFDIYNPKSKYVQQAKVDQFIKMGCFSPQDIMDMQSFGEKQVLSIATTIDLLVHLNIAAEIPMSIGKDSDSDVTESSKQENQRKEYFLPAVLQTADTSMFRSINFKGENDEVLPEPLCIRFITGYLPLGFVCALSANLMANNKLLQLVPFKESNQSITYKNMMKFRYNGEIDIILLSGPKYCEFHIKRCSSTKIEFWDSDCCPLIKTIITEAAQRVVQSMHHGDSVYKVSHCFELTFKCPLHKNAEVGHEPLAKFVYDDISNREPNRIICCNSECNTASLLTPEMKIWFGRDIPDVPLKIIEQPAMKDNVIKLKAEGTKPLKYQWYMDNVELINGDNYWGTNENELFIRNLDPQVKGDYHCVVRAKRNEAVISNRIALDPFVIVLWHQGFWYDLIDKLKENGFRNIEVLKLCPSDADFLNIGEKIQLQKFLKQLLPEDSCSGSSLNWRVLMDIFWNVRAKWYLLGIQLEVEHHYLDEARIKADVHDQYEHVLKSFMCRKNPPPSWSDIKQALKSELIDYYQTQEHTLPEDDQITTTADNTSNAALLKQVLTTLWGIRAQWKRLAGQMDKIMDGDSEAIETDHPRNVDECFAVLLHKFLTRHNYGDSALTGLVEALNSRPIGRYDLAVEFQKTMNLL